MTDLPATFAEDNSNDLQRMLWVKLERLYGSLPAFRQTFEQRDFSAIAKYLAESGRLYDEVVPVEVLQEERRHREESEEMLDALQGSVRALLLRLDNEQVCEYVRWGKRCPEGRECAMCRVYNALDMHEKQFRKAAQGG